MPTYEVVWQMTGTARIDAEDELAAHTQVDVASNEALLQFSTIDKTQVIAMRKIE